jgi:hypothetical protein
MPTSEEKTERRRMSERYRSRSPACDESINTLMTSIN